MTTNTEEKELSQNDRDALNKLISTDLKRLIDLDAPIMKEENKSSWISIKINLPLDQNLDQKVNEQN